MAPYFFDSICREKDSGRYAGTKKQVAPSPKGNNSLLTICIE